ncbi:hypothetical protein EON65_25205 [archaeon]|nr:MAG: hypothetical protein EON65_25205 [archaeon]
MHRCTLPSAVSPPFFIVWRVVFGMQLPGRLGSSPNPIGFSTFRSFLSLHILEMRIDRITADIAKLVLNFGE